MASAVEYKPICEKWDTFQLVSPKIKRLTLGKENIFSDKQNLMFKKFPWLKKMIPIRPQVSAREWREPEMEKEMAVHSSVLAWRIPEMGEPGGLPSMGLHRVGHDWSDLVAAEMVYIWESLQDFCFSGFLIFSKNNYLKES